MGVLDEKIKIWKLSLTWEQIHEEQRMRGAFRIFIDENMRSERKAGGGGGTPPILSPPHTPVGQSKLASDGRLSRSLVSELEQRQWHTWPQTTLVKLQWFPVSGTNSKEPNNKRYFQARQWQKQSSAALKWRLRRGRGLRAGVRRGHRASCI